MSNPRDERFVLEKKDEQERSTMYVPSWGIAPPNLNSFFIPSIKFEGVSQALSEVDEDEVSQEVWVACCNLASAIDEAIVGGYEELQIELDLEILKLVLPEWPRYFVRSAVWNRDVKWLRKYWLEGGPLYDPNGYETAESEGSN